MSTGMPTSPVRTFIPGPGGYLIAAAISLFTFAVVLLVPGLADYGPLGGLAVVIIYVPLLTMFCAMYGLPVAVAGVVVVHLVCRRIHPLVVHVIASGVTFGALGWLWVRLTLPASLSPDGGPWTRASSLGAAIGASAALGRLLADRWLPTR